MFMPLMRYSAKNFVARKTTTAFTVVGVALVVFVFAAVLMMANGIQETLVSTGEPNNIHIARKASNGEISSIIPGDEQNIIRALPRIAKSGDGAPIVSGEPVVIINLNSGDGALNNISVRGVSQYVKELRPSVKLKEGRWFNYGQQELIVGKGVASRYPDAQIGKSIKLAGSMWKVVGTFEADGNGFESEIWLDALQLLSAFNRGNTVSTITLKLENIAYKEEFMRAFAADTRLREMQAKQENEYFAEQSEDLAAFIRILGIFVTVIFSLGATIGATITMYAAVANRTVEIGTLRALGFRRRSILAAFLTESLLLSLAGGIIGVLLASILQFFSISTINFSSFSEIRFSFAINATIVIYSIIFALIMGMLGGFLPSVRASRMRILQALRAVYYDQNFIII